MAFGKSLKDKKAASTNSGGEKTEFGVWPWMNTGNGIRKFRILPELLNGEVVKEQILDAVGKPVKGKFTTIPETEIRWLEAWWSVMVDGKTGKRRFMLDINNRWKNPLWKYIEANYEKGSEERRAVKQRFGVNVFDQTPVVFDSSGNVVYSDIKDAFVVNAMNKALEAPVIGDPKPLNQVRILEGSAGDPDGKHLLQQIADAADGLQDNDGVYRNLSEVTLLLKTTGAGIKTNRAVRPSNDYSKLPDEVVVSPRYDIAAWIKPWPDDMIQRAIELEDFNELVEEYGIQLFPQLTGTSSETKEEELFD